MIIKLSKQDILFLKDESIAFSPDENISEDDAFALLDEVYSVEAGYGNGESKSDLRFAKIYGGIADRIQRQIPE